MFNNKEKLLIISFVLFVLIAVYVVLTEKHCYPVEYQDLNGSHTVQVCEKN